MSNDGSSNIYDQMMNLKEFFITTPMIDELSEVIHKWHLNGFSGGVILGSNRIGKTSAIQHVKDRIYTRRNQKINCHFTSIAPRDVGTITGILRQLCYSAELSITENTRADIMANDLIYFLGESATNSKTPHNLILFIDEMQRLRPKQFEVFAELYDGLMNFGIHLSIFFVGNHSASVQLLDKMKENPQYELIRGRFLLKFHNFYGIRKEIELKACLSEIDQKYLFTKKNSYTKEYLWNQEVSDDWRLIDITEIIWQVYEECFRKEAGIESWPIQYFLSMIRILLFDFIPNNGVNDPILMSQMVEASINASGLIPDEVELV